LNYTRAATEAATRAYNAQPGSIEFALTASTLLDMRPQLAVACAAAIMIALAGCGSPAPVPTSTSDPSETPTASPTPSPTATAEALTLVDCEIMLPIADARALFSESTEFLGERPPTEFGGWFPVAEADSILAAAQAKLCTWGVPNSDGSFSLHVIEITPAQRTALEAALGAAGFSTATVGTVTTMELTGENEIATIAATHLFTGDLWIMSNGSGLDLTRAVTTSALDALRTANPTLGL
jgi:hypothetical protein